MAPRKRTAPESSSAVSLPPPNTAHPQASLIPAALGASHPHPSSYHSFLNSPFFPAASSSDSTTKKRSKSSPPSLPALIDKPVEARVLHEKLLAWFDRVKESRAMPWRKQVNLDEMSQEERTQRGYEVWVSEIMLQQTQVVTVIAYFNRWLLTFPTVASLAAADTEAVNEMWKGLGYYSRASRLLAGAKTVMKDFVGKMPESAAELENIDGIGPYSAGAISSIAFAKRSPMVDGNVTRVLSRLTALHAPATAKVTTNFIWALADVLVPPQSSSSSSDAPCLLEARCLNKPGAWNQGLMELGATVCTPKAPKCGECPLSEECLAYAEVRYASSDPPPSAPSIPDLEDLCTLCSPIDDLVLFERTTMLYPMAKERKKPREEETAVCVLEWDRSGERKVLLAKRPEKGLLAGLFEFPAVDLPPSTTPSALSTRRKMIHNLLSALLYDEFPFPPSSPAAFITIDSSTELAPITHVYSHVVRTYHPLRIIITSPSLPRLASAPASNDKSELVQSLPGRCRWIDESEVEGANTGGAVGKVWEERERDRQGLPRPASKLKSKKVTANRGGEKRKIGGGGGKEARVPKRRKEESDSHSAEETIGSESQEEPREEKLVVKKPYKKRRIAASNEDEDD